MIMANKALAKRQKMTIRAEPSQKASTSRNPTAIAGKQRAAGSRRTTPSVQRQLQQHLLQRLLGEPEEDK